MPHRKFSNLHSDLRPFVRLLQGQPLLDAPFAWADTLRADCVDEVNVAHARRFNLYRRALGSRRWVRAFALVLPGHRLAQFKAFATDPVTGRNLPDSEYWHVLGFLLQATSRHAVEEDLLRQLLLDTPRSREEQHRLMSDAELIHLRRLPETISVFRGCGPRNKRGWSWTLSRATADFFARTNGHGRAIVLVGTVRKSNVLAYFQRSKESEIFICPEHVTIMSEERPTEPQ